MTLDIPNTMVDSMLRTAKIEGPYQLRPIRRGRNNQVAELISTTDRFVLKRYFQSKDDTRDRMKSEIAFYRFAEQNKLMQVPRLLAADEAGQSVLLSYAAGQPVEKKDVSPALVSQAIDFFVVLNRHRDRGNRLPDASERCNSIHNYVTLVDTRLMHLATEASDADVRRFLTTDLIPLWQKICDFTVCSAGDRYEETLSKDNSCISPSDFGFHNAVLDANGRLTFLDFEYAGWDDPARAVCDFFCHVAVPVAKSHKENVTDSIRNIFSDPAWFSRRVDILMPISQVKWCCHILNEFLPVGLERRKFSGHADNTCDYQTQFRLAQAKFTDLARSLSNTLAA